MKKVKHMSPGDTVTLPADRGEPKSHGTITGIGTKVETNVHGTKYVWVSVKRYGGPEAVWPSNRLGLEVE